MTKAVYICSSLRPEVYDHVTSILDEVKKALGGKVVYLRPDKVQLLEREAYVEMDVAMIKHADEVWVLGQYGRDCSWEIGYATALGKQVVLHVDNTNKHLVEQDWMLLHGMKVGLLSKVDLTRILGKR